MGVCLLFRSNGGCVPRLGQAWEGGLDGMRIATVRKRLARLGPGEEDIAGQPLDPTGRGAQSE